MHESTGVAADEDMDKPADASIREATDIPTEDAAHNLTEVVAPANKAEPALTYEAALDTDINYISEAAFFRGTKELCKTLSAHHRPAMSEVVKHHLGLQDRAGVVCNIAPRKDWLFGGFNVCIPVTAQSDRNYRLILRIALSHKLAERRYPGTVDEKTACEVAAYVWLQEKCPDIPIPQLYGFSFSDSRRARATPFRQAL